MTAVSRAPANAGSRSRVASGAVAAAGIALLLARPTVVDATDHPVASITALFGVLLAVGLTWPLDAAPRGHARSRARLLVVTAVGAAAFAVGRLTGDWRAPATLVTRLVALNTLAAVAEEAFFRRFVYRVLERHGDVVAIVGSAGLFALVHVTVYGWWVFPLDLAAGLLLSWQRWASGSWTASAITHVVANVLALAA